MTQEKIGLMKIESVANGFVVYCFSKDERYGGPAEKIYVFNSARALSEWISKNAVVK